MTLVGDLRPRGQLRRRHLLDAFFRTIVVLAILVGVASLAWLLQWILRTGLPRLDSRLWSNFPSTLPAIAGAKSAIWGTVWLIVTAAVITVFLGIGAAIYLEEFARADRWYNRVVELNIQNLAAVPSIVYGILGLAFIVRGPLSLGPVIFAGALILALLVLPVVIISSREALRAVPQSIRHAGLALGATPLQTTLRQTVPAASPGIATGIILGLSRAIGEAAPLLMLGAFTYVPFMPTGLDSRFTALPVQIYSWIQLPQAEFKTLAAAASIVLLALMLVMNGVAIWLRNRFERRW